MQNDRRLAYKLFFIGCLAGAALTLCTTRLYTYTKKANQETHSSQIKTKRELVSECYGYTLWNQEKKFQNEYSLEDVIRGMRACVANEKPLCDMEEHEMKHILHELQLESYEKVANENLRRAEEFLAQTVKNAGIRTILEKKIYYQVLCEGNSSWQVLPSRTYLFHYTITTLNNDEVLDTRKTNQPKQVCLDEVIPGFSKGVVGMIGGERRKLFIHPNLAYRTSHWLVPPQSLLIVDVEALADVPNCNDL